MLQTILSSIFSAAFIGAILRVTTPILLPSLGALLSDRTGVINIGLEGIMLSAAFTGVVVSAKTQNLLIAFIAALLAATSTPGHSPNDGIHGGEAAASYFDGVNPRGSFRVGRDRRSWLFSPGFTPNIGIDEAVDRQGNDDDRAGQIRRRKCC